MPKKKLKEESTPKKTYKDNLVDGVPMSEDKAKFHEDWGPEDCVSELRGLAEEYPDKVISRNFCRVNSRMSESTWNRYFGTFTEFKRQAGITLTRQQHKKERDIAKHASVDHYRELDERQNWGEDYIKDSSRRDKTILIGSDLHDIECDKFYLRVFLDVAKRLDPTDICLNGDIFDLPEFGSYSVDPRNWKPGERIKFVHDELFKPLRESCPDTNIDLLEGNHEYRLAREGADFTNAIALLEDVHGKDLRWLLGLDKYEINYISKAKAATFTKGEMKKELQKNWKVYYDTCIAHHFPIGQRMGMPGWHGHHHKHIQWPHYSPVYGAYEWHQLGAGHIRYASYTHADDMWQNGFMIAYVLPATKRVNFEYIQVSDFAVAGGKFYYRNKDERF